MPGVRRLEMKPEWGGGVSAKVQAWQPPPSHNALLTRAMRAGPEGRSVPEFCPPGTLPGWKVLSSSSEEKGQKPGFSF